MAYQATPSRQRSLFCECNQTHCHCWPSSTRTRSRSRSQSRPQPPPAGTATQWPHYTPAQSQQLPTPHTADGSHASPSSGSYHSPNLDPYYSPNSASSPSLAVPRYLPPTSIGNPSPNTSAARSPQLNQIQLHPLLKAQSILRTPDSPSALRLRWDVRDPANTTVIVSSNEPEYLYEHPMSAAYATTPPVPFLLVACDEALPWLVPVHAQQGSEGVTVRDVLEAIHGVLYTPVENDMLQLLPTDEDRDHLHQIYHERIERNGTDQRGIIAVDWLGEKSLFVCLERNETVARKRVKEESMWPYVFALKLTMRKGALVSDA